MNLFDHIKRFDFTAASHAESRFAYLNRSARTPIQRMRALLEDWFSHYPAAEQPTLRGKFRSTIDHNHLAALFELYLHELLLRLGCQVEIHPHIIGTDKHPDFRVTHPDSTPFYLEATLVTMQSARDTAAQKRMSDVYDGLNRLVQSPDYFIGLSIRGTPDTPPPFRKMAEYLNRLIAALDYDQIVTLAQANRIDEIPRWEYVHDQWVVEFFPMPKSAEARGKPDIRPLGMFAEREFRILKHHESIRAGIKDKIGRYGELDLPYLLAANILEMVDDDDIVAALLGDVETQAIISLSDFDAPAELRQRRTPNGVWTSATRPLNTRLSGLLAFVLLNESNLVSPFVRLYHNPWSQKPYDGVLMRLPQATPENNRMTMRTGEPVNAIIDFPANLYADVD